MTKSRRTIATAVVILAGLGGATAAASTPTAVLSSGTLSSATLTACTTGVTAAQDSATFSAQMQSVRGTDTMAVSFQLAERTAPGARYVDVSAPGFDVWQVSKPHIGVYTANENVSNLPQSASFRAVVSYRWINRHHTVIRRATRVTPPCRIVLPEPNLSIVRITRAIGTPRTTELYGVVVRNSGTAAAGPFSVALSVGATPLTDQTVTSIAPASTQTVQFSGPRCTAGMTLTAQADPTGTVVEPANPNRTFTFTCGTGTAG